MGFSISDLNPVSLLSNAAESICDAVLPKDLEFVGDLVGLAADLKSGNWMKSIEDFQDLAQDLPKQLEQLGKAKAGPTGAGDDLMTPSFLEPTPPPPYGSGPDAQTTTTTTTTTTVVTTTGETLSTVGEAARPARPNPRPGIPTTLSDLLRRQFPSLGSPPKNPQSVTTPLVRGTPGTTSPPPAPTATPTPSTEGASAPSSTTTTAPPRSADPSSPTTATAGLSADAFFALSDTDLMNAVRDGKVPPDVKRNPEQMQRLQLRMNDITEMNQLITTMVKALHDMNSQVIQNIRV